MTLLACTASVQRRPSVPESQTQPPPPSDEKSAGVLFVEAPPAKPESRPDGPTPEGMVWVEGYWRWTGVEYEWIPGRYEPREPAYVR